MRFNGFLFITLLNILFTTFYPTFDGFSGLNSYRKLNSHDQASIKSSFIILQDRPIDDLKVNSVAVLN